MSIMLQDLVVRRMADNLGHEFRMGDEAAKKGKLLLRYLSC